jgi:hypothetical protein
MKSLATLGIFALLAIAIIALSGSRAGEPTALAKGDRLSIGSDCSQQVWPNFAATCLRYIESGLISREVRVVNLP